MRVLIREFFFTILGRKLTVRIVYWTYRCKHALKQGIAALILKSGLLSPLFSALKSRINEKNFQEFLNYRDNFDKFAHSTIVVEKLFQADRAFYIERLKQDALKIDRPDIVKTLDEYINLDVAEN